MINANNYANVRVSAAEAYSSGQSLVDQNTRGDLCVAQSLPPYSELTRLGGSWYAAIPTGNAFTPVAAMPTTRSELSVRNGYTDTTCLVIDQIGFMSLTSLAAASAMTIVAQINAAAALTNNTAILVNSMSGRTFSEGNVTRALATTTAVANCWMALNGSGGLATTTTIGLGCVADVQGRLVIRPGYTLHTNVVFSTAAGTAIGWISWHEVKLPLVA